MGEHREKNNSEENKKERIEKIKKSAEYIARVGKMSTDAAFEGYKECDTGYGMTYAMAFLSLGFSIEEMLLFIMDNRSKEKKDIRDYLGRHKISTKEMKLPKFADPVREQRETISKIAEANYIQAYYETFFTVDSLQKAIDKKELTKEEFRELNISRDFLKIILKPGSGPDVARQNISTAKYLLAKDIDKDKVSAAELTDIKKRRCAEVFNRRMEEVLETDFDQFRSMDDARLAAKWKEYYKAMYVISTIRTQINDIKAKNPYIDNRLCQRALEVEESMAMIYTADTGRMEAMASTYYPSVDTDFLTSVKKNVPNIEANDDTELLRFMKGLTKINDVSSVAFAEDMTAYFNDRYELAPETKVLYFSADKGNAVSKNDAFSKACQDGSIIAVPEGHPELASVLTYDTRTLKISAGDPAKKAHAKALTKVKAAVPGNGAAKAGEKRFTDSCEALLDRKKTVKTESELISSIADSIMGVADPEKAKNAVLNHFRDSVVTAHPGMSYRQFTDLLGIKGVARLSKREIKDRLDLSRNAFQSMLETEIAKKSGIQFPDDVKKILKESGIDPAAFTAVMCAPGEENREANIRMVREFFGYGPNGEKRQVDSLQLTQIRSALIEKRLMALAKKEGSIPKETMSDAEIVARYSDISEISNGLGKEWKGFVKELKEKLNFELLKETTDKAGPILEQADRINSLYTSRMDYIASEYYQYGGEKELGSEKGKGALASIGSKDHSLRVTVMAMSRHALPRNLIVCDEVLSAAGIKAEEIDFAYDTKGQNYEGTRSSLGEAFANSGEIMLFRKGEKNPVILKVGDVNKHPVQASLATPKASDLAFAKMARSDMRITRIANDVSLSSAQKQIRTAIVKNEYELDIIAERMKGLSEEKQKPYRNNLKNSLSSYIARVMTDHRMLPNAGANDKIYDEKQIAANAKKIKTSQSLEKLLDVMLKEEDAFSEINPGRIFDTYLGLEIEFSGKGISEQKEGPKTGPAESPKTRPAETSKTGPAEVSKNAEKISAAVL